MAWFCAHAGQTARAVEIARATVAAPARPRTRPYLLGTLGVALVLDGQHAAAVAPLREALASEGPRWAQAVRRYYLGVALAGLGRLDEARVEWQQAATLAPRSRWGRRAQERLDGGAPAAYRLIEREADGVARGVADQKEARRGGNGGELGEELRFDPGFVPERRLLCG